MPRQRNLPVMILFGGLLVAWALLAAWLAAGLVLLGAGWGEWWSALDPRGKPTDWWFWYCLFVVPPVAILGGLGFAFVGRWRAALLTIPIAVMIEAGGGMMAYAVDRHLLWLRLVVLR